MKPEQILWIKCLDPNQQNGTIQSVLQDADLQGSSFENTLKFILKATLNERETLMKENSAMARTLKKHNLYTLENIS